LSQRIRVVNFSLTHRCNFKCSCCYQKKALAETDTQGALALVERLAKMGVATLMVGGGEPLLRADLTQILARASALGMQTFLGSNGSLLDERTAQALRAANLSLFFLGMDDPLSPGSKDGTLEQYSEALAMLERTGIGAAVNLIVTRQMVPRFEETLVRIKQLGARHVNLLRPRPDADGAWFDEVRLGGRELKMLRDQRLDLCARLDMLLSLDCSMGALMHGTREPAFFADVVACSAGIRYFHLDPRGDVYPCPYLTGEQFKLGNVMDDAFLERWESEPLLVRLRDRDGLQGKCGACDWRRSCGGCRALALRDRGDLCAADPDCPF